MLLSHVATAIAYYSHSFSSILNEEFTMPSEQQNLFGKTFDQQLAATGNAIEGHDISPNRRISGEIVFEPIGSSVRVTARDAEHRLLWGFVASSETVNEIICEIATYETLQRLIATVIDKPDLLPNLHADPIAAAKLSLKNLAGAIKWLEKSLDVQTVAEPTLVRALAIARIASDAERQIMLEASSLQGMKSRVVESDTGGVG